MANIRRSNKSDSSLPIYAYCRNQGGENRSIPLEWDPVEHADFYKLVVIDPDAVGNKPFVHWFLPQIPPKITAIPSIIGTQDETIQVGDIAIKQGLNSLKQRGYHGACPPPGTGVHRYIHHIYAIKANKTISESKIILIGKN